jgi:cell division protein FtsI (penicillin-binding protein 3)
MSPEKKKIDWPAVRIAMVALLFACAAVLLCARAYRLQVKDSEVLKKRAEKQRTRVLQLESRRGMIYDRSGEEMAASLEVSSIYARPRKVPDRRATARKLAQILEADEKEMAAKLAEEKPFVWIQRQVSPATADRVKEADLPGIMTASEFQRFYPLKSLAAHALGFAGMDSKGLEGVELSYDADLRSEPVPVTAQRDALGRPVMFASMAQDPGRKDLYLTIDRNIQYVVERELHDAVARNKAKSAIAVVMNADTGEVLAMAVRPTYNLNTFQKVQPDVRRNRAVADAYEPGSTFKTFLAAAVLDLDKVNMTEKFDCNNGLMRYHGSEIHDVAPHKMLNFEEILINSSNIGAVKVSERLTKSEFYDVLRNFGFGSAGGIDLPGERPGDLPVPGRWSVLTKANIAFGQGVSVTPVQLTAAFAAAVNGGYLYRPYVMQRMTNSAGEVVKDNQPIRIRRVVKESTSKRLVGILREVVDHGTGKAAAIQGVDVIGKTGTAQKADPSGGYSSDRYVASFIGAIMSAKPRLAILVMLDEPGVKIRTGGKIAAPLFKKIAEDILSLCGSLPGKSNMVQASPGSEKELPTLPARIQAQVKKGPNPGEWVVPDLKGLDMRQVLGVCGKIKCDVSFEGTGTAAHQDPPAGAVLKEGGCMTVKFQGYSS